MAFKYITIRGSEEIGKILNVAPIKIGNSSNILIVFFDLKCPFCARMFNEAESYLLELARKGLLSYVMCDYIVHDDAVVLHAMLREVEGAEARLKFVEDVYNRRVKDKGGAQTGLRDIECHEIAEALGVVGTPALLFYDDNKGEGQLIFGYIPLQLIRKLLFNIFKIS
ncbi:MAG: thioredoxin fold domain-containing protein [Thermoproteus sp.]|nr:thioredoxin fold domain-containing protein [Thermoproteus sp.]